MIPTAEDVKRVFMEAIALAHVAKVRRSTAVRRVVGTAGWRDDPERVAAAEAKRERKRRARAADRETESHG